MLPLVFVSIFLLGVVLLVFGLRGRRVGDEPHCRKCKYNLTGAVSDRCPECGGSISLQSICWGMKRPLLFATFAGILLMVGQISFLYQTYNRATWLQYFPFWLVLIQADSNDRAVGHEIIARYRRGALSTAQRDRLFEAALESFKNKSDLNNFTSLELAFIVIRQDHWMTDEQEIRLNEIQTAWNERDPGNFLRKFLGSRISSTPIPTESPSR